MTVTNDFNSDNSKNTIEGFFLSGFHFFFGGGGGGGECGIGLRSTLKSLPGDASSSVVHLH